MVSEIVRTADFRTKAVHSIQTINRNITMLAKYNIEYGVPFRTHTANQHHLTDDPVACEEFLADLLEHKFKIVSIHHQGVELPGVESDRMIKTAAGILASRHLCASLGIDTVNAHDRFGTPA